MTIGRATAILVVDDHGVMIKIIRSQLRQLGLVDVDEANNGAEALKKMRARHYDLILADWYMEPMSGLDLLKAVRDDVHLRRIAFIMVTGESRPDYVIAAKNAGVSGYIVMPFNVQMLKAKIDTIFATRSAPLVERSNAGVSQPAPLAETSGATAASDIARLKFPGQFTSSS